MVEGRAGRIVVLGGGTADWLAAAYFGFVMRQTGISVSIIIVETSDIPTVCVGEGPGRRHAPRLGRSGLPRAISSRFAVDPESAGRLTEIERRGPVLLSTLPSNRAYGDRLRANSPIQGQA